MDGDGVPGSLADALGMLERGLDFLNGPGRGWYARMAPGKARQELKQARQLAAWPAMAEGLAGTAMPPADHERAGGGETPRIVRGSGGCDSAVHPQTARRDIASGGRRLPWGFDRLTSLLRGRWLLGRWAAETWVPPGGLLC